jgi:hypothetical protein
MRAISGAIVTAGAMIGLGLTALGYGYRYAANHPAPPKISEIDGALLFALVYLTCLTIVGLGISFLGLAYEHHHHEREHLIRRAQAGLK